MTNNKVTSHKSNNRLLQRKPLSKCVLCKCVTEVDSVMQSNTGH